MGEGSTMNGKLMLYVDQYGMMHYATSVRELGKKIGGKPNKMYIERPDGSTVQIGYVVGDSWCTAYTPWEKSV